MPPLYCNSRLREKEITGNLTSRFPGLGRQGKRQKAKGKRQKAKKRKRAESSVIFTFNFLLAEGGCPALDFRRGL
jgi:hypothetical protein